MDKNILIGAIIGAALGIIVYLQSLFKTFNKKRTKEYKTEQKFNNTTDSLYELKQKGILTDQEYNTKISKIEKEKEELNLKNTTEYKELKNLLDSGIISNEEFESKIDIIDTIL